VFRSGADLLPMTCVTRYIRRPFPSKPPVSECLLAHEGRGDMYLRFASLLVIAFLVTSVAGPAPTNSRKIETVSDFLDTCKTIDDDTQTVAETFKSGYCSGWASGMIQGVSLSEAEHQIPRGAQLVCAPEANSPNQIVQIVRKYVSDHPEKEHTPMTVVATQALAGAFPCTDQKQARR
jgi:Rap1a immunity proteins